MGCERVTWRPVDRTTPPNERFAADQTLAAPAHTALEAVAQWLRCPLCEASLSVSPHQLRCEHGHDYDRARQGHVTLLARGRRLPIGDPAPMVAARARFLGAGHYEPIAAALSDAALEHARPEARIVDLGAGTGHHLAAMLRAVPAGRGLALDASRAALRAAMRAHPRIAAVACDVWQPLPLRDATADVLLNVFAPRNPPEMARVLAPGGVVLVVTPTARHLRELRRAVPMLAPDPDKEARLDAALAPFLRSGGRRELEFEMVLRREELAALICMGPSGHHLAAESVATHVAGIAEPFGVLASVRIDVFRPA